MESELPNSRRLGNSEGHGRPAQGSSPQVRRSYIVLAICGLLLMVVIAVFAQTAWFDFVNYDDPDYVYDNSHVKHGLSWKGFFWAITAYHASNWHPLSWISHMLDCQLYGLNPSGHHLTNVLLHGATAVLLFLSVRRMTGALWSSAWVAAIFAIHPLRVESVAWVAEREDVLSGLFFMLTLWFYSRYVERPASWGRYFFVVASCAIGLTAKPMLVTLPFVLLLLDYWPLRRFGSMGGTTVRQFGEAANSPDDVGLPQLYRRLVVEKLPLFVLAAAVCVLTTGAQQESISPLEILPFPRRMENTALAYVAYVWQMIFPSGLAVLYPFSRISPPGWQVLGAVAALSAVSTAAFVLRRRFPYFLVGWLWYLGMMVPVIGLVQVGRQMMADRYTYLPQIGLYIAIAWGAVHAAGMWPSCYRAFRVVSVLVVVVLMGCAWRQTRHWRDSEKLWTHALECTSRNSFAHYNFGVALSDRGDFDEAIAHYQKALEFRPNYAEAHYNLGMALKGRGQIEEALVNYQKALEINPDFAEAHINLGNILADRREVDAAIAHYQKALELKPDNAEAENNLGTVLGGRGRNDEAIAHYRKALKVKPDYVDAHNNLGAALVGLGQLDEAIACFRESVQINPDNAVTRFNLGMALAIQGKSSEALEHYLKALALATTRNDRQMAEAIRARIIRLSGDKGR